MTTTSETLITVERYELATDRYYDPATHLWVMEAAPGRVRCGFDPLGSEMYGDLVALALEPDGTRLERGEALGSLEAAKFVGPIEMPVSGRITERNEAVLADPGLVQRDPLRHWLVELELTRGAEELPLLLRDADAVREWFAGRAREVREKGMLAQ